MHSSTSSSEARFFVALALTLGVLVGAWEGILRRRAGGDVNLAFAGAPVVARAHTEEYVIFGNCLMMTGISPRRVEEELTPDGKRVILNIAAHEQSPIAFFEYLRAEHHYPDVVVTNVSSWINDTNFEQEGILVRKNDPLHLGAVTTADAPKNPDGAFREGGKSGHLQEEAEAGLDGWASEHLRTLAHRYHLFDFGLFVGTLVAKRDLDVALYQLNMQSWFRVKRSEAESDGFLALDVDYREDWPRGLEWMADRSLQRLRLSRMLTGKYWELLEENVRDFRAHGTQVLFVRMPEHPKIKAFNDETYEVPERLRGIEERTGAPTLDLSALGPADGVRLFDAVHPDARASEVISRRVGTWLRAQRLEQSSANPTHGGGG